MRLQSAFLALSLLTTLTSAHPQEGGAIPAPPTGGSTDPSYSCPSSCTPPSCQCASTAIPGGLSKDKTPMFVTLTYDDSVQVELFETIMAVHNRTQNSNGCDLPGTFFVSTQYTDFWLVQRTYGLGSEVACHTINHFDLRNMSAAAVTAEIDGCRKAINAFSGVPASKLTGFRHPFLSFSPTSMEAVQKAGFEYDSSIVLDPNTQAFWPHTLDYGMPYNPQPCTNCPPGPQWKLPGLWEIPMYALLDKDGKVWASMDPIINPQLNDYDKALDNLKKTFDVHYEKKLPMGLYQHISQLVAWVAFGDDKRKKQDLLTAFFAYTQQKSDVYFVTNQQLLAWIKKPVPTDQMSTFLPCILPATDKSNKEICDGIDNNGDGAVDEGLVLSCQITPTSNTRSCFGCPAVNPNVSNPVPDHGNALKAIPADGCPNLGSWDPAAGSCLDLKRPQAVAKSSNGTQG
ncbi:hypothetical protein HK097_002377, partial [Rhizophlyctis rosea]